MRVLVFEPKFVGHFLGFSTWTANAFARLDCDVVFAVPRKSERTEQAQVKLAKVDPRIRIRYSIDVPVMYQRWKNASFESAALLQELDHVKPEFVVAPSADFILSGLLVNRNLRNRLRSLKGVDFILHNCRQGYPAAGRKDIFWRWVDRLAVDMARGLRLHTVDPYLNSTNGIRHSMFGSRILPLPHPFESLLPRDRDEARSRLGIAPDARLLGSLGDLGPRKGTELLIHSFARSQPSENTKLILYGLMSADVKSVLQQYSELVERGQIITRDEFVPDETFADFVYAVDALWAGYPRQIGIASLLLFAAEACRPVIASDFGCVGWMVREYGLGVTCPPTVERMSGAIREFFESDKLVPDKAGIARLLDYHTLENFESHITHGVNESMRNTPSPGSGRQMISST